MTLIDRSISFDADSQFQPGTKEFIYICNHSELLDATITEDGTSHEIDAITMDGAEVWYKYELIKSSNLTPSAPQDGIGHRHTLAVMIKTITQLDVNNLNRLKTNKAAVICPLIEGRAKLFGRNVGLLATEMNVQDGDAAAGGMVSFTLITPENEPPEIELPHLIE